MKLSREPYLYLTQFADDRTILNMLSVNKKFNDPKFFQQVMIRKYPLLVKNKPENQSWKQFYISMTYCISKIQQDHGISYYHVKGYNPQKLCNLSKQDLLEVIMYLAAKEGHIDVVEIMGLTLLDIV